MMVPHPNEGPLPYKYGSVDDSEQPASYSSLLPRSSRCSYPAVEQQHLPQHKNKGPRDPKARSGVSRRLAVAVLCGLAFLAGCGVSLKRSISQSTAAASGFFEVGANADFAGAGAGAAEIRPADSSSSAAVVSPLEFTALNFYHVRDGKPGQDYPWLKDVKLIEPYRDTTLAVVGAREGFVYRWEVRSPGSSMSSSGGGGGLGEVQATATGAVTIVVLTQLHEHVVVLEEVDGDGRVTNRLEETVLVKYVRREIRTLTNDEREELLDAVSVAQRNQKQQDALEWYAPPKTCKVKERNRLDFACKKIRKLDSRAVLLSLYAYDEGSNTLRAFTLLRLVRQGLGRSPNNRKYGRVS